MPRTKKNAEAQEVTAVEETKVKKAVKKAAPAAEEAAVAVEAAPKKAAAPRKIKTAYTIEFGGAAVSLEAVEARVEEAVKALELAKKPKDIQVYIKPEDGKAYFVADDVTGMVDLF